MPAWLKAACRWSPSSATSGKAAIPAWCTLIRNGVSDGMRNTAVIRLAGHLLRRHVNPLVTLELLLAWNTARCRPPLEETEVTGIVDRVAALEMKRRGSR
jgi:hypothetical protein